MDDQRDGNPATWVERHGDALYRYALVRLRSPDLAAEVVQETFLDALRALATFAGQSTVRTWLFGILRHKIVDHFRASARRPTSQGDSDPFDSDAEFNARGKWRVGPQAWAGDPAIEIETREFWDVFGDCLSRLPASLADVFFLREIDGLASEDVQSTLGITPANYWARMHRARAHLRRCLEASWFGREPNLSGKGSADQ